MSVRLRSISLVPRPSYTAADGLHHCAYQAGDETTGSTLNVVRRIPFGDQAVDRREAEIFWP